jgi:predicted nucleic acid-binding protein
MPNRYRDLAAYHFTSTDRLAIDTNVWLYLFPPDEKLNKTSANIQKYVQSFQRIVKAKAKILIDAGTLSEYINRYARLEYNVHNQTAPQEKRYPDFKKFRQSSYYKPIAEKIAYIAGKILARCECIDTPFSQYGITKVLDDYSKAKCDFNDSLLLEICKACQCNLITNDSDFRSIDGDIDILTHLRIH